MFSVHHHDMHRTARWFLSILCREGLVLPMDSSSVSDCMPERCCKDFSNLNMRGQVFGMQQAGGSLCIQKYEHAQIVEDAFLARLLHANVPGVPVDCIIPDIEKMLPRPGGVVRPAFKPSAYYESIMRNHGAKKLAEASSQFDEDSVLDFSPHVVSCNGSAALKRRRLSLRHKGSGPSLLQISQ
jgi:hypothetical protein